MNIINPRISRDTRVIVQGITGRAGQLHSRLMMQYGTRIVGGVSPGAKAREVLAQAGIELHTDLDEALAAVRAHLKN